MYTHTCIKTVTKTYVLGHIWMYMLLFFSFVFNQLWKAQPEWWQNTYGWVDLATHPRHLETEKLTTAITALRASCMCHYITKQPSTANNNTTVQTPNLIKHCITRRLRASLNHRAAINSNTVQTPNPFKRCITHRLRVIKSLSSPQQQHGANTKPTQTMQRRTVLVHHI